jgi:mannonate dehydratase
MADAKPQPLFSRRRLMLLVGGVALFSGAKFGKQRLSRPLSASGPLSAKAQALLAEAWKGLDPKRVIDTHVHMLGSGEQGSGCFLNKRITSPSNPWEYFKFTIYENAAGVTDTAQCDVEYVDHLAGYFERQKPHGRALIFAFDQVHDENGNPLPDESEFFTPNEYVLALGKRFPDYFVPAASVHPYRKDCVEALEKAVEGGAVAVKWLPNAMNIDPASPKCDAFYEAMARLKVPLISHAGEEKAVHSEERQRLGNPLKLRHALEKGVSVVVAHCASLGQNPDLDAGEAAPWVDNFALFKRLMADAQWKGRVWGDVSAMTLINRVGPPLQEVLSDPELRERLVNGSDYPLAAINVLMWSRAVQSKGFITEDERDALNEIDQHDPLLFDFVMKRCLKWNGARLPDATFLIRPEVFPRLS